MDGAEPKLELQSELVTHDEEVAAFHVNRQKVI